MIRTQVKAVNIAASHAKPLTKGQKAFNALIKQIEKKRALLAAWEGAIVSYQAKYTSELLPLIETLQKVQAEMVHCLDRASKHKALTKSERRRLAGVIAELAGDLVAANDDPELKAIYNKYSRSDYDAERAANAEGLKSMLEDILDIDLGDDEELGSTDEVLKRAQAHMHEKRMQFDAERDARQESTGRRRKTAKQLVREAQQHAEAQQLKQSIREIYRKLASALHPDREADPAERQRKTELMQRVNQAYAKNNLLQLLELQLELEHIDQAAINGIGEQQLKHFNTILREQLADLQIEILRITDGFRSQFGISALTIVSPSTIVRDLGVEIAEVERTVRDIAKDLLAFGDIRALKAWLKAERRQSTAADYDDVPF